MRKELRGLLMIFIFTGLNLSAQNPYIQHYTTADGLPSNMVYQVYQDSSKFIWFATDAGVARFDGSKFTYYRKQDGLSCNNVVRIKEDSQGRIWFFNLNATLNFFFQNNIYNETNAPFLDSLKSGEFFRDFFEDKNMTLYFYYNHQRDVFSLDSHNHIRKYRLPSILFNDKSNSVEWMVTRYINKSVTNEFNIWAQAGFFKMKELSGDLIKLSTDVNVNSVFPASNDRLYITKINDLDLKTFELIKCNSEFKIDSSFQPIRLLTLFYSSVQEDRHGYIWISTFDKGVYCFKDHEVLNHFDIKEAQAVIEDHEGNIWISSLKDGVYKISPYVNQHIQYESSSFENSGISALSNHTNNGVWCTNGKTVYLIQNNNLYTSDFQNEESSFNQILQVNKNTLLVGEISTRQFALEGIQIDPLLKKVHFNNVSISLEPIKKFALSITGNEVSTFNHFALEFINPDELFRNIREIVLGERVFNTFYNTDNELIVNAKRNYLYKNDSLVICEELSCFDNKIITDHLILNNAKELFNIEGDSLFLLNNKLLYNLTSAFDYPIDLQIKYMDYFEPTLYIATTRNIYTCEYPLDILDNKPIQLQPVDISFRNIHDILFNGDLLYIASDDGLTAIPYTAIHEIKTNSPIPYFQSIQINDDKDEVYGQDIVLSGRNRIHIDFNSINYSFSPVIFSYKLEGADDDWTIGTGTNVVYQDLPKGDYIFKLKVRKPTSDWSGPIEYGIRIKATIWQHPLFYLVLFLFLLGLIFLSIIWRKNTEIKRREIEHQLVLLEQKALQSMMNPHFIFNTLGSIQNYLLQSKPGDAGLYLSQFARLVRQNLNAINTAVINLEEEVDRLKNYMDLEKLRLEDKFDYHIDIDRSVESEDILIPSMIIQPFVENAIWHGIANLEEKGLISIRFSLYDEKSLQIIIEDNGIGITNAEKYSVKGDKHLKLGMQMTRKRMDLLGKKYNVDTHISFSEVSPGRLNPGTRIELVVPFTFSAEE